MRKGRGIFRLLKPVGAALVALQLAACASLGDEAFGISDVDTGAPAVETATAPADLGGGGNVAARHPHVVLAVAEDDPFEDFNRVMFHINDSLDTHVVVPIAETYRWLLPDPMRQSVRNAFANLGSPVTFANDVLQGEWGRAHVTFNRFLINSTVGIAGLHDPAATYHGLQPHYEDFDQTMALHGFESGPYMVLPIIGPTTPRHLMGRVVDSFAHPLTYALSGEPMLVSAAPRAAELTSTRAEYLEPTKQLKDNSPDHYAAVRSFYRQSRSSEIGNGVVTASAEEGEDAPTALDEDLDLDF